MESIIVSREYRFEYTLEGEKTEDASPVKAPYQSSISVYLYGKLAELADRSAGSDIFEAPEYKALCILCREALAAEYADPRKVSSFSLSRYIYHLTMGHPLHGRLVVPKKRSYMLRCGYKPAPKSGEKAQEVDLIFTPEDIIFLYYAYDGSTFLSYSGGKLLCDMAYHICSSAGWPCDRKDPNLADRVDFPEGELIAELAQEIVGSLDRKMYAVKTPYWVYIDKKAQKCDEKPYLFYSGREILQLMKHYRRRLATDDFSAMLSRQEQIIRHCEIAGFFTGKYPAGNVIQKWEDRNAEEQAEDQPEQQEQKDQQELPDQPDKQLQPERDGLSVEDVYELYKDRIIMVKLPEVSDLCECLMDALGSGWRMRDK